VPSMRRYNPRIPERLEAIIRKSLAKSVAERYQTADEFAEDLLDWLFEAGNKVSSRDLIRYIRDFQASKEAEDRLREAESQKERSPGGGNLIIGLIQEEMLNFRSLGATGEEQQEGPVGSKPIVGNLTDVPVPRPADPSRPLDLGEFTEGAKPPSQADVPSFSALLQDAETSNSEATPLVGASQSQSVAQAQIRAKPPVPTGDNNNPLVVVIIIMAIMMVGLLIYAHSAT